MDVLVAGGSGFIGRSLCRELADRGHAVTAASRAPDASGLPPDIGTAALDVTDDDVTQVVAGHDAVVNLVALPSHVQPRRRSHDEVHRGGTQTLLRASESTGVSRFVQLSGLGVDSGVETAYFDAKREAENLVRASDLEWVIYRPSVVFGDGAAFLSFVRRLTALHVVALPNGGRMRIQPLWVGDLVPLLAAGVEERRHVGEWYELGGPSPLTLAETVRLVRPNTLVVPLPMWLAAVCFTAAEFLPGVPLGRDQYRVQRLDNTPAPNDVTAFGVEERRLTSLHEYLDAAGTNPRRTSLPTRSR